MVGKIYLSTQGFPTKYGNPCPQNTLFLLAFLDSIPSSKRKVLNFNTLPAGVKGKLLILFHWSSHFLFWLFLFHHLFNFWLFDPDAAVGLATGACGN